MQIFIGIMTVVLIFACGFMLGAIAALCSRDREDKKDAKEKQAKEDSRRVEKLGEELKDLQRKNEELLDLVKKESNK